MPTRRFKPCVTQSMPLRVTCQFNDENFSAGHCSSNIYIRNHRAQGGYLSRPTPCFRVPITVYFTKAFNYTHHNPALISELCHSNPFSFRMAVANDAPRPNHVLGERLDSLRRPRKHNKYNSRENRIASNSMWTFDSRLPSEHKAYKITTTPWPKAAHGASVPVKSRCIVVHPTHKSFRDGPGQDCRNSVAARRPYQELGLDYSI